MLCPSPQGHQILIEDKEKKNLNILNIKLNTFLNHVPCF